MGSKRDMYSKYKRYDNIMKFLPTAVQPIKSLRSSTQSSQLNVTLYRLNVFVFFMAL